MDIQLLLRRPAATAQCCRRILASVSASQQQVRHKATRSRQKRALNIPPHESYQLPFNEAGAKSVDGTSNRQVADRIIFNPPSSEASVYHTPHKMLPRTDPRRFASIPSLFENSATIKYNSSSEPSSTEQTETLPPAIRHWEKQYNVTEEQVHEIRRLRLEDPIKNSVNSLAYRFKCSRLFILMVVNHREANERHRMEKEAWRAANWGPRRAQAHEDRMRRLKMMMRGEI